MIVEDFISTAGLSCLAFSWVDLGWFQAARVGDDTYPTLRNSASGGVRGRHFLPILGVPGVRGCHFP